ncbi:G-I-Y Y-I-G endonuclease [Gordonia phage GodonK]|uniref:G-I-Y Y-I-G endonuclease n=1 Tax=Gordonia phage GodonK TaxID=2562192 RepID=A0A4D6E272_9CAUD|nr:G-I-Y Y-I-G endonuclease [Gordonia phage GodonK]QBZ72770.1 G-I-Y Y-I-G endonuclease [Gordonia phage GodonK]
MVGVVYGLYHQDSLIYVGSCADPGARYARHKHAAKTRSSLLCQHIQKHGMPEMKIFVEVHDELLYSAEKAYIAEALKHGPLLNMEHNPANAHVYSERRNREDVKRAHIEGLKRFHETEEGRQYRKRVAKSTGDHKRGKPAHPNTRAALAQTTHKKWHVGRGIVKPGCKFCEEL